MNYTSSDKDAKGNPTPRGEIWLRGPAVFKGYYKDKEKTEETLTEDGWLRTGDIGMLVSPSNNMKIIDRVKNIFKLQQGEYVAAEKVEAIYTKSELISEVFLHGDSTQNFAVAVVTVRKPKILELGLQLKLEMPFEELCQRKEVRKHVCADMNKVGKEAGLMGFEQAKNVCVEEEPTFLNKGLLSNTLKMQRFAAKQLYGEEIGRMYEEGPLL